MIKCPNCAGEVKFDPATQKIKCNYCGSAFEPKELSEDVKAIDESKEKNDSYEGKTYRCTQCGATLMTFDDTAITFCSYCGSQAMLEDKMIEHNNPDIIIPFKITKEECINAYKQKVSKFLFAPDYMKSDITVEKFRGIYMPYAIYNLKQKGTFLSKGSKYSHRRGDYVYYDDYQITTDSNISYDGVSYDLVSKFYDNFSTSIPFNYKEAVKFNPSYMAGFYADSYDVKESTYNEDAVNRVKPDAVRRLKRRSEFSKYGCSSPNILFNVENKNGMFPAYFLAIRDKKNENVHYAVVNGQTGKVATDLPIDFKKYFVVSVILSIIIFILINSFVILTPTKVTFFSIIMSLIALIISKKQINGIEVRAKHKDDKGVQSLLSNDAPNDKKKKWKNLKLLYKEILAIIIPIIVAIINPVSDEYYYFASFVSLVLIVLSVYDLVKEHNILVSNKLPQLEKRGGEENE